MQGIELTKVKYTHSGDISRNPFEMLISDKNVSE
jgi:hypothetical protein